MKKIFLVMLILLIIGLVLKSGIRDEAKTNSYKQIEQAVLNVIDDAVLQIHEWVK